MESQAGTSILVLSLIPPHDLKIVTSFILWFLQLWTDPNYVTDKGKKTQAWYMNKEVTGPNAFLQGSFTLVFTQMINFNLKQIKYLTLAWYCSRITWPGNSGSGTEANFLIMSSSAWRPAIRSWLLWSVAAMNAMRIRSERWSTRRSSKNKNRRQKVKHLQN